MLVSDAIKYLQELKPDEEIVIGWWEQKDSDFTTEQWENIIAKEHKIDWFDINEQMNISSED